MKFFLREAIATRVEAPLGIAPVTAPQASDKSWGTSPHRDRAISLRSTSLFSLLAALLAGKTHFWHQAGLSGRMLNDLRSS